MRAVLAAKGPTKDTGTPAEQQFVRSLIELHDKYLAFVSTCFNNASLFHKSLKVSRYKRENATVHASAYDAMPSVVLTAVLSTYARHRYVML